MHMTNLAKAIWNETRNGNDAEQILAKGIGSSVYEIEFIQEQLKMNGYE